MNKNAFKTIVHRALPVILGLSLVSTAWAAKRPNIIIAMALGGALAGFVGINEIMGFNHRILLNFQFGYGFTGIAVSLIGRNHPFGILLASLLFGILYQGGAELAFETQTIDRHMVVLIQGLVILFAGALENLFRPQLQALVRSFFKTSTPVTASG